MTSKGAQFTLIANVPYDTVRQDLVTEFRRFGRVELAMVVCDEASRHPHKEWTSTAGYAFVRFSKRAEAAAAIQAASMGLVAIRGVRVRADWARKDSYAKRGRVSPQQGAPLLGPMGVPDGIQALHTSLLQHQETSPVWIASQLHYLPSKEDKFLTAANSLAGTSLGASSLGTLSSSTSPTSCNNLPAAPLADDVTTGDEEAADLEDAEDDENSSGAHHPGPALLLPSTGFPTNGFPTNGFPTTGLPTAGLPTTGLATTGLPSSFPNMSGLPGCVHGVSIPDGATSARVKSTVCAGGSLGPASLGPASLGSASSTALDSSHQALNSSYQAPSTRSCLTQGSPFATGSHTARAADLTLFSDALCAELADYISIKVSETAGSSSTTGSLSPRSFTPGTEGAEPLSGSSLGGTSLGGPSLPGRSLPGFEEMLSPCSRGLLAQALSDVAFTSLRDPSPAAEFASLANLRHTRRARPEDLLHAAVKYCDLTGGMTGGMVGGMAGGNTPTPFVTGNPQLGAGFASMTPMGAAQISAAEEITLL
ncbi:putative RNA recognition motif protein [Gregarina niphandrodes]|uniref:RNA recognition motif protein n=1 Tax=Gregarina niphandrodes TaxID=110365 RepID=A0A023BC16_GRENI|nr:putative RNA recognition motif protein [Gregarina niphandrodes]EZG81687.1 putative RNA recognition motif protein [Gregarina niphandrodes]|eukprot:XP_011134193.1 putative RNA recognition motif protein [Gregarina niphandrodes]